MGDGEEEMEEEEMEGEEMEGSVGEKIWKSLKQNTRERNKRAKPSTNIMTKCLDSAIN